MDLEEIGHDGVDWIRHLFLFSLNHVYKSAHFHHS
jgi:hypothetical protein